MALKISSTVFVGLLISISTVGATAAAAQNYPDAPPQGGYDQTTPGYPSAPGYDNARDQGPDVPPPPNYDGSQLPPPPVGYQEDQGYRTDSTQDRRYESYTEDWSQRYCVKARSNTGAGAVIGGIFGALLGSGLSGRHDHGNGALIGGLAGAAGGAAIGSTTGNATSPGCPPGFVVRNDAPAFAYADGSEPYYYAAPDWYRPWYFYEGRWAYRPYPYHNWYYRNYGRGGYGGYDRRNGRRGHF